MSSFFFFNDTATTEIYTLSLHDALPISGRREVLLCPARVAKREHAVLQQPGHGLGQRHGHERADGLRRLDRKSTRLNSSHLVISYAVFCLKKKKTKSTATTARADEVTTP